MPANLQSAVIFLGILRFVGVQKHVCCCWYCLVVTIACVPYQAL